MAYTCSPYPFFSWCLVLRLEASAKRTYGRSFGKTRVTTLLRFLLPLGSSFSPCLSTSCRGHVPFTSLILHVINPMMNSRYYYLHFKEYFLFEFLWIIMENFIHKLNAWLYPNEFSTWLVDGILVLFVFLNTTIWLVSLNFVRIRIKFCHTRVKLYY